MKIDRSLSEEQRETPAVGGPLGPVRAAGKSPEDFRLSSTESLISEMTDRDLTTFCWKQNTRGHWWFFLVFLFVFFNNERNKI